MGITQAEQYEQVDLGGDYGVVHDRQFAYGAPSAVGAEVKHDVVPNGQVGANQVHMCTYYQKPCKGGT